MEFRLLGPLEVRGDGGAVPLAGAKQRSLLAILLLHANEVVSRDSLLEELWPDRPRAADHSLDVQISRLRKALQLGDRLVTRSGGYVLEVEPERIDARRFERLLDEGRRANAAGDAAAALELLREALGLWRGPALADLAYEPFARVEAERLDELRLAAIEERLDAELALGRHGELVAELEALAAKYPLRERLRAQLMLALYRSGRQAEALRVYGETRRRLVTELGLEPGQALQQLEQAILRQDPALSVDAAHAPRRRRRSVMTTGALALAAAAAAAGVLLFHGGPGSLHAQALAQPDSVGLLAADNGKIVGEATVDAPILSRFGEGSLWTLSFTGALTRIDPASGRTLARLSTRVLVPCGLAAGERSVWVIDCSTPTLVRIDPSLDPPVAERLRVPTPEPGLATQTEDVVVGAGSVWVGQGFANPSYVHRLDPRTGRVQKSILIPEGGAQALAFGDGALWVANEDIGQVSRIDARTNEITATRTLSDANICCLAAGGGYVWVATRPDRRVWKLADDASIVTSIRLTANVENLAYADGAVWAAEGEAGTVVRIDAATNGQRTYRLGHHLLGVAERSGLIAVGVQESARDVTAGLEGSVLHVALKDDYFDWSSPDPAGTQAAFNPWQVQFQYATCAKLFNYPDAGGTAGMTLAPEVAAGFPPLADGGRTVAFRIRRGFRFSPPSNEPVTAESFRHELERVLSRTLQPGPWGLAELHDIVGATAYHEGKATHVAGISAHGDRLVIRLVKPAPDLPARLAQPQFCAVPVDTPTVLSGVSSPLPSAGPYYLAAHAGNAFVLKRNPNYHGPRPHRFDAIVYRTGVDVGDAAALVARGKVDYVEEEDPALAPRTALARTAGPRYRLTPNSWTEGLALNPGRPLFADARLRRAVAYALDRRALAAANVGLIVPTSRVLPPKFREPGTLYPLVADLPAARRLTGGRRAHAVFAAVANDAGKVFDPKLVAQVQKQLGAIGVDVTVVPYPQSDNDHPAELAAVQARADLTRISGNASQTRDPVEYLRAVSYLRAADRASLERIATYSSPRRESAAAALAAKLERDGVVVGYADRVLPELVSKRLGCIVEQPEFPGLDLAALCLR